MDNLIGFVGKDYVLIASDTTTRHSIVVVKDDEDKTIQLDSHKLLALSGEQGDRVQFGEFIAKNIALNTLRSGIQMSTHAAANFTRGELAHFLRQSPYFVNILLAGYDNDVGPSLYFMDYLSSMHKMDKAGHGYGSYFILSTLDRLWKPGMSLDEGLKLMGACIQEIKTRLVINSPRYLVKVIDKDGVRIITPPKN